MVHHHTFYVLGAIVAICVGVSIAVVTLSIIGFCILLYKRTRPPKHQHKHRMNKLPTTAPSNHTGNYLHPSYRPVLIKAIIRTTRKVGNVSSDSIISFKSFSSTGNIVSNVVYSLLLLVYSASLNSTCINLQFTQLAKLPMGKGIMCSVLIISYKVCVCMVL